MRLGLTVASALGSWLALKALVCSSRGKMVVGQSDYPRVAHFRAWGDSLDKIRVKPNMAVRLAYLLPFHFF